MEMIPTELWMQIAMKDPRAYNALARTSVYINKCLDAGAAQKSFISNMTMLYESMCFHFMTFPALGGLVHTLFHVDSDMGVKDMDDNDYHTMIVASYGKLTRSVVDQPSFWYIGRDFSARIYADKGVITRDNGPAVLLKHCADASVLSVEIHVKQGSVTAIHVLGEPSFGRETILVTMCLDSREEYVQQGGPDLEIASDALRSSHDADIGTYVKMYGDYLRPIYESKANLYMTDIWIRCINKKVGALGAKLSLLFSNLGIIIDELEYIMEKHH